MRELTPEALIGPLNSFEQKNAPKRLFVEGPYVSLRADRRVSIVGSRTASPAGLDRAARLAQSLAREGIVVVSGLARGIDTRAHEIALANGGRTVAVLGTPLDITYPPENRDLRERIAREHLVISQFPAGSPAQRKNFVIRNRLMALISDATVIVEAGETSGSLAQGWEALRLGRPVFLCKALGNSGLKWPEHFLDHGAHVLATEEDLLDLLPTPVHAESYVPPF